MTNNRITHTIAALFDEQPHADLAIENLVDAGITRSAITLSKGHGDDQAVVTDGPTGIWGILGSLFFPEDDQNVYAEGLRRGGYLVTVSGLTLDQKEAAANILDVEGSVDLDDRSESWRSEGWSSQGLGAANDTADFANSTYDRSDGSLVGGDIQDAFHSGRHDREVTAEEANSPTPIIDKAFTLGKRDPDTGRMRVRSYTVEASTLSQQLRSPEPH